MPLKGRYVVDMMLFYQRITSVSASLADRGLKIAVLIGVAMSCSIASGQALTQQELPPGQEIPSNIIQLGAGDSVTLQVYGQPDMTTTTYIGDDGSLSVPLAGAVSVGGLSPADASRRIEAALKKGGYLVDPQVSLTVVESRSQRVSVLGQVGKPGVYPIQSNTTIFDLLALAGGELETGSEVMYLLRPDASGVVQRYAINLKGLDGAKQSIPMQTLRGGDSIFVPRAQQFYIYGEVTSPNKYRVEADMTVIQAIARAGGITPRGSERRVDIKRMNANGKYVTVKAKLNDIVKPDDVIHVKESIF
jgi:polysaccharide export outer membrane protein